MGVPEEVRRVALFPDLDFPESPAEHRARRVSVRGVFVRLLAGLPVALVSPVRIEESEVEAIVGEVRRLLRAEGREKGIWVVPEEASPADLAARLGSLGMRPNDVPGVDPRGAAMVIVTAPPAGPPGVVARRAASFEEFRAAQLVAADSFTMDAEMRRAFDKRAELLWSDESANGDFATFVAFLGEEIIASGGAAFGRSAVHLAGAGTHPNRRRRGAYTALVRARWDAAVERGTPVLAVHAGEMSRPILERLGFTIVGWADSLLDELTGS